MNCNVFISHYHAYSVTQEGKVYNKFIGRFLPTFIRDGHNEVKLSLGVGMERIVQWMRTDWLVAMRYIPNVENYSYIEHIDGNTLNDNVSNLRWKEYCTDEEVKEIDGYRGKYLISKTGRVYNNFTGRLMKSRVIGGYFHVALRVFDGEKSVQKLAKVHRLVAEAFLPNPDNLPVVNHIDGDKLNNNVGNLEWVTYSENNNHAIRARLHGTTWTKELGAAAITLIEDYKWSSMEVALFLRKPKSSIQYLYQRGYKNLGLKVNNSFVKKTSKHEPSIPIPDSYRQYIINLLEDNTVLNAETKASAQCND